MNPYPMSGIRPDAEGNWVRHSDYADLAAKRDTANERLNLTEAKLYELENTAWRDGEPDKTSGSEWFIAQTKHRDRVVLRALHDEHSYDYTTADGTHLSADHIVRWMQFPDSHFLPPDTLSSRLAATQAKLEQAQAENLVLNDEASAAKRMYLEACERVNNIRRETLEEAASLPCPGRFGISGEKWDGWSDEKYEVYQRAWRDAQNAVFDMIEGNKDDYGASSRARTPSCLVNCGLPGVQCTCYRQMFAERFKV